MNRSCDNYINIIVEIPRSGYTVSSNGRYITIITPTNGDVYCVQMNADCMYDQNSVALYNARKIAMASSCPHAI